MLPEMEATKDSESTVAATVSVIGNGQRVTVNSGSLNLPQSVRQVLVTPVSTAMRPQQVVQQHSTVGSGQPVIVTRSRVQSPLATGFHQHTQSKQGTVSAKRHDRILLKAVHKGNKKGTKTFTLRNIDPTVCSSPGSLKGVIRKQLEGDITTEEFDVGFVEGTNVVRIRSSEDLAEFWSDLKKPGTKLFLWCDGLIEDRPVSSRKRDCSGDIDSDSELEQLRPTAGKKRSVATDREDKVQEALTALKEKHSSQYTPMQLRIWAEMVAGGIYSSFDEPPNTSMFVRAGGGTPCKRKQQDSPMVHALNEVATVLTTALSPRAGANPPTAISSPAKVIESRSKLYKQLSDLQALRTSGVLTEEEYEAEKEVIMELLKKLNPK